VEGAGDEEGDDREPRLDEEEEEEEEKLLLFLPALGCLLCC